jgi:hypothetical protein
MRLEIPYPKRVDLGAALPSLVLMYPFLAKPVASSFGDAESIRLAERHGASFIKIDSRLAIGMC